MKIFELKTENESYLIYAENEQDAHDEYFWNGADEEVLGIEEIPQEDWGNIPLVVYGGETPFESTLKEQVGGNDRFILACAEYIDDEEEEMLGI